MSTTNTSGIPKVTVYIPAYNQEELIKRALESIPKREDIEILVIDDCSTDGTYNSVKEYIKLNPGMNVRLFKNEKNMGVSVTNNTAYNFAHGEYVYELDSDDYLHTCNFIKAMEYLDGTDLVYVCAEENSGLILTPREENHNLCAGWFKFIRRGFLGRMRRVVNDYGGDYEMNLEMIEKPHTKRYTDIVANHYNYPREGSVIWNLEHKC